MEGEGADAGVIGVCLEGEVIDIAADEKAIQAGGGGGPGIKVEIEVGDVGINDERVDEGGVDVDGTGGIFAKGDGIDAFEGGRPV